MSEILFLGSVGSISALDKNYTPAGMVILHNQAPILIDPGVGTLIRLVQLGIKIEDIKLILASGITPDQIHDLTGLSQFVKDKATLIAPQKTTLETYKQIIAEQGKVYNTKQLDIYSIQGKHRTSYKIQTTQFVLSYIPQFIVTKKSIAEIADSNIIIYGCSHINSGNSDQVMNDIIDMCNHIQPELLILAQHSNYMKNDPLEYTRALKKKIQELKLTIKTQILPVKEGMHIDPGAYNVRLKQKQLGQFE